MDDFKTVELYAAKKHNANLVEGKKSLGDFFLQGDKNKPVNVKSSNLDKNNYSPNIISAKRLMDIIEDGTINLNFMFVSYKKIEEQLEIVKETGLISVYHISWNCLSIQAQGWGVVQMPKKLEINEKQTKKDFIKGLCEAYKIYIEKERWKLLQIENRLEKIKEDNDII